MGYHTSSTFQVKSKLSSVVKLCHSSGEKRLWRKRSNLLNNSKIAIEYTQKDSVCSVKAFRPGQATKSYQFRPCFGFQVESRWHFCLKNKTDWFFFRTAPQGIKEVYIGRFVESSLLLITKHTEAKLDRFNSQDEISNIGGFSCTLYSGGVP